MSNWIFLRVKPFGWLQIAAARIEVRPKATEIVCKVARTEAHDWCDNTIGVSTRELVTGYRFKYTRSH